MSTRDHVFEVAAAIQPVVQGVPADHYRAPTPCTEYDVEEVANHMLGTVEAMRRIGAGEPLDPDDPWGTGGDHMEPEWRTRLSELLRSWAQAWSQPESWEGDAMDGAMPRQAIGDMGYVEVMLHGWDLARGTGQDLAFGDDAVAAALEVIDQIGEQGRSQGAFGPEVKVSDDADDWDRVLGRSGRDPGWTAG